MLPNVLNLYTYSWQQQEGNIRNYIYVCVYRFVYLGVCTWRVFFFFFLLRLRAQVQAQSRRHVRSESRATAWYVFEVRDHINIV